MILEGVVENPGIKSDKGELMIAEKKGVDESWLTMGQVATSKVMEGLFPWKFSCKPKNTYQFSFLGLEFDSYSNVVIRHGNSES